MSGAAGGAGRMRPGLLLLGVALLAVASIAASVNLWQQLRAARLQGAQLRAQLAVPDTPPTPPPAVMPVGAGPTSQTPPGSLAPAPQAPAGSTTIVAAASEGVRSGSFSISDRDLLRDPEYRRATLENLRQNARANHPGLAAEMGWSDTEAAEFFDLLARHSLQMRESLAGRELLGEGDAAQQALKAASELNRRQQAEIAALLGPRHAQYEDYRDTRNARTRLESFGNALTARGQPLSEAQSAALVEALKPEIRRMNSLAREMERTLESGDANLLRTESIRLQSESNLRMMEAMRPHLSAEQYDHVRATLESQITLLRATERLQRQRQGAVGAPGAAVPIPQN